MLKQRIGYVYVTLDFIYMGLVEWKGMRSSENYKKKKIAQSGIDLPTLGSEAGRATYCATEYLFDKVFKWHIYNASYI